MRNTMKYQADVVVVGEGLAGLSTALSAAEQGLKVIIVTASKGPVGRGGAVHASYSRLMQEQGYERQEVERFYLEELASQFALLLYLRKRAEVVLIALSVLSEQLAQH